jgi:hypothetical protein
MYAVNVSLGSRSLSTQMVAMRVWLDEHHVEPSKFTCRDGECGMLVCIEFKIADDAEEFAERFSGGTNGSPAAEDSILETGLSPDGLVG